jgi:hypothetical protein
MTHYRAYLLDSSGQIEAMRRLLCESDAEACAQAQALFAGRRGEVWTGHRKVAGFMALARAPQQLNGPAGSGSPPRWR